MIRAITFDLWDTVIHDGSDEPKRAAAGLPPKREARRALVRDALAATSPVAAEVVDAAYDVADAAFSKVWHEQHITWSVAERLSVLLGGLGWELLSLADTVVDGPRCMRRIGDQTWRGDPMGTNRFNSAGAGRSLCISGGHGTPPRNAAQFIPDYAELCIGGATPIPG